MNYVLGIDLGTTYSCVSYIDEYGKPVVLKNTDGEHTTPSVVMVESEDNIIVGNEAKRSLEVEPDKTVQFIKRKMGRENDSVTLNGTIYHAPEISSMILKKLVNDANEELKQTGIISDNEEVKDVVITCPAYFGMNERQATKIAGELAGLHVLNIINEPTAAAISYGISGKDKNETVLVYDLGGGTFDITVMNIQGNNISVVCTGGDDQLGGKDWDEALLDYVVQRYEEEYDEDLTEDPEMMASLYVDVENWKKSLTSREKVNISVNGPEGRLREVLTRDKYEELTSDLLNRTKNLLDSALTIAQSKGFDFSSIDKVLLVGGSSRMPQVSKMIEQDYHVTPVLADPDEAVSKGAAIYASNEKAYSDFVMEEAAKAGKTIEEMKDDNILTGELDKKFNLTNANHAEMIQITNVLSRTYGVKCVDSETKETYIKNMLMINDMLPATKQDQFCTADQTDGIVIALYETRSTEDTSPLEDKQPLTEIKMKLKQIVPENTPINVYLSLDNAGILHIQAEELYGHTKLDTTFQLSNQMSDNEIRDALSRMNAANID